MLIFCSRLYSALWANMIGSPTPFQEGNEMKSQIQKKICKVVSRNVFCHGTIISFASGSQSTLEAL